MVITCHIGVISRTTTPGTTTPGTTTLGTTTPGTTTLGTTAAMLGVTTPLPITLKDNCPSAKTPYKTTTLISRTITPDDNTKKLNFNHYFSNLIFSRTIAYTGFTFFLVILQTHLEGTVSQISYLYLGFIFMHKSQNI